LRCWQGRKSKKFLIPGAEKRSWAITSMGLPGLLSLSAHTCDDVQFLFIPPGSRSKTHSEAGVRAPCAIFLEISLHLNASYHKLRATRCLLPELPATVISAASRVPGFPREK
jgi:hypothetical protein